jgi:hypothetical protein
VNAPGAGTPTGNVNVTVSGGAETCSAPVATGQCSITLNTTGARTLTATYAGDTNFNTSSDTESHQVCGDSRCHNNCRQRRRQFAPGNRRRLRWRHHHFRLGRCVRDAADNYAHNSGEILIDKNLTINAGSSQVTISGNNASRVFNISSGKTVNLIGLTISGGNSAGGRRRALSTMAH